mgnify:CR=1 FL=1
MAEQKRIEKKKEERPTPPPAAGNPEAAKKREKIRKDIEGILDEIDDLLEENAEEFVKSYVQKGGE